MPKAAHYTNPPVLLIDGNNLLFRSHYSAKSLRDDNGFPTGAIYGFLRALKGAFRILHPKLCIVCWDYGMGSSPADRSWRQDLFAEYKANRSPSEDSLAAVTQRGPVQHVLGHLGLFQIACPTLEADDVIAILVHNLKESHDCVIVSSDHDLYQLLCPQVKLLTSVSGRGSFYTGVDVEKEYGIAPAQWPYFRALMGDPSDNIPGAKGIGPKKAVPIVREWATEDGLQKVVTKMGVSNRMQICEALRWLHLVRLPTSVRDLQCRDKRRILQWEKATLARVRSVLDGRARLPSVDRRSFTAFCVRYGLSEFLADRRTFLSMGVAA